MQQDHLFSNMTMGLTLVEKFRVIFRRLFGCDHEHSIDVGDSEHTCWYCYDCCRRLS